MRKEDRREEKKTQRNPAGTDAVQKTQIRDTRTLSELGGEDITRRDSL